MVQGSNEDKDKLREFLAEGAGVPVGDITINGTTGAIEWTGTPTNVFGTRLKAIIDDMTAGKEPLAFR